MGCGIFHRHSWVVVEKTEQPSAWQQTAVYGELKIKTGAARELFVRPVIVRYRCQKCGAERVARV